MMALAKTCAGRLIAALLIAPSLLHATASPRCSAATGGALDPRTTAGVGPRLDFVEYEAESGATKARIVGPDVAFTTLAAEASGRRAVLLEAERDFVEFTLSAPANALTVRYAVPDGPDAGITDAALSVYANGKRMAVLPVTSRYCCFYGRYPFTKNAPDGNGHHFFDHARTLLDRVLPPGTVVRLMRSPEMKGVWCAIDLVDFELVPAPLKQPPHSLSVVDYGADRRGESDSREAFSKAIAAAASASRPLLIPPGHFRLNLHLEVDRVEIAGAGAWYSILQGDGVGLYGRNAPHPSQAVDIHDLAIIGEVRERDDRKALAGIGGALGGGSRIHELFIQHVKVGLWLDGPFDGLLISHFRVFDTTPHGPNLHRGISNATLEENLFPNNADDGIAAWADNLAHPALMIRHYTALAPI